MAWASSGEKSQRHISEDEIEGGGAVQSAGFQVSQTWSEHWLCLVHTLQPHLKMTHTLKSGSPGL